MRIFRILVAPVKREQQFLESYWISPEKNSIRIWNLDQFATEIPIGITSQKSAKSLVNSHQNLNQLRVDESQWSNVRLLELSLTLILVWLGLCQGLSNRGC